MMRSFFFRRLRKYFVLIMLPSLLMFTAISVLSAYNRVNELKQSGSVVLENVSSSFSSVIENISYQQNMLTLNPQLSLSLKKILMRERSDYTDFVFLNSMESLLASSAASHPAVESIYMYLDSFDNFLSSAEGVQQVNGYYDANWLDIYLSMAPNEDNVIIRRTKPDSAVRNRIDVLSVYQRLTYINGIMVINIRDKAFAGSMEPFMPSAESMLFVTGPGRDVLMSLHGDGFDTGSGLPESQKLTSAAGSFFEHTPSGTFLVNHMEGSVPGTSFILLTPLKYVVNNVLRALVAPFIMLVLIALLILLLAYQTTKRNFRQIEDVIRLFEQAQERTLTRQLIHPSQINNEYDLIINNVIRSFMMTTFLDRQLAEEKYRKQAAELAALQMQINPHFLMNTLQTLDFEVARAAGTMNSPAGRIISDLSQLMRYSLAPSSQSVTVRDEIENVRKYLEIQSIRFPDVLNVEYRLDEAALDAPLKRLILQPLVENSISHGIRPAKRKGTIVISVAMDGPRTTIACTDDGIGIPPERLAEICKRLNREETDESADSGRTIGLYNVNRRLILNYGRESALKIESGEKGTKVSFSIPSTWPGGQGPAANINEQAV